jgi:hypothetical protein
MVMEQQLTIKTPDASLTIKGRVATETRAEYSRPKP